MPRSSRLRLPLPTRPSVHSTQGCTACHTDIKAYPHPEVAKVNCGSCHTNAVTLAGSAHANSGPQRCLSCHGDIHSVLAVKDPKSPVYPLNLPRTCGGCHFSRGAEGIDEYIVDAPDYVGLGNGAFGYIDGTLYATTFSLRAYSDRIERGLTGATGEQRLGPRERMRYDLLMRLFSLRLEKAWVRKRYGRRIEHDLRFELTALKLLGAMVEDEAGWSLTDSGMFHWVQMMSGFFESVNEFREQMRHQIRDELEELALATPGRTRVGAFAGSAGTFTKVTVSVVRTRTSAAPGIISAPRHVRPE